MALFKLIFKMKFRIPYYRYQHGSTSHYNVTFVIASNDIRHVSCIDHLFN